MILREIQDLKIAENFIKNDDELWDRVSEDGNKKEDFILDEIFGWWWIGCFSDKEELVGIFWIHQVNSVSLQIHAHVKKEHRKEHAYECGKSMVSFFVDNMPKGYEKLIAEIPEIYQDVINFTKKFGFEEEGINRKSYKKNNKIVDQYRFGLIKEEAKLWLQQQQ